jgi:hypothetical protein
VGGGTCCRGGVRATAVGEGGPSAGACCVDGGGVGARAAVGASDEASERERGMGNRRVMSMPRCMIN